MYGNDAYNRLNLKCDYGQRQKESDKTNYCFYQNGSP